MNNINNNINALLNLKENDNLIVNNSELVVVKDNSEFKIIDNNNNLYQTIFSSLLYILHLDYNLRFKIDTLDTVENCLYNIYENKQLSNDLETNEEYDKYFDNIHSILYKQNIRYRYNKCNSFFYELNDAFNSFLNYTIKVSKSIINHNRFVDDSCSDTSSEDEQEDDSSNEETDTNKED